MLFTCYCAPCMRLAFMLPLPVALPEPAAACSCCDGCPEPPVFRPLLKVLDLLGLSVLLRAPPLALIELVSRPLLCFYGDNETLPLAPECVGGTPPTRKSVRLAVLVHLPFIFVINRSYYASG